MIVPSPVPATVPKAPALPPRPWAMCRIRRRSVSHPTQLPRYPADVDIPVNITLEPNLNAIDEQKVILSYVVNWGAEQDAGAVKVASGPGGCTVCDRTARHNG